MAQRSLADLAMQSPGAYTWPVSFLFEMQASWGWTTQELSVDVPELEDEPAATRRYGELLWRSVIAPAISVSVQLRFVWVATWRSFSLPIPTIPLGSSGGVLLPGTGRVDAGQLVLLTGHNDSYGKRRLFLPGIPLVDVDDGLLTRSGFERQLALARGIIMGITRFNLTTSAQLLLRYPNVVEPTLDNPLGQGFREVSHIRVCQHTDRAPDPSGQLWP